jgi:nicotinamide riboside kinase
MKSICLHGPESVGKSTMATLLAVAPQLRNRAGIWPRLLRGKWNRHRSMHDLVVIAQRHTADDGQGRQGGAPRDWLILDTDPVMTAVWAEMMHGRQDPWFTAVQ